MTEEQLIADYQEKCRELEADEDSLKNAQRTGEQLIQETLSDIYRTVQDSAVDSEPFDKARQAISQLESDYYEELARARKQVYQQQEDAERAYQKDLESLSNQ